VNPIKYFFLKIFYGGIERIYQLVNNCQNRVDKWRYWKVRRVYESIIESLEIGNISGETDNLVSLISIEIASRTPFTSKQFSKYIHSIKSYQMNNDDWKH